MNFGNIEGLVNGTEQVVFDYEVTGSAVSSISTGNILNGDEDGWYTIISFLVGPNTGSQIRLRLNNDSGANYGRRGIEANGTTVADWSGTGEDNLVQVYCDTANYRGFGVTKLYAKSGAVRLTNTTWLRDITGTTVNRLTTYGGVWNNTADNITNMTFYGNSGDIGVGSRIIIIKSNNFTNGTPTGIITTPYIKGAWVRVGTPSVGSTTGSIILPSSGTSISFTGLDGNTAVCYAWSVSMKNAAASANEVYLRFNGLSTSIYGRQSLYGANTTVGAERETAFNRLRLTQYESPDNGRYLHHSGIMLSKSGFLRPMIGQSATNITGTTVAAISMQGGVVNDTSSNIESITFEGAQASGLAAGTQFDLYALYK